MEDNFNNSDLDSNQDLDNNQENNSSNTEFSIPEEYKDKGWTKFFDGKTGDELKKEFFRSYDNSQTLIGKKVQDYINTTDLKSLDNFEEIKEALTQQLGNQVEIPENAEGYAFNDILKNEDGTLQYEYPQEVFDFFGDKFKELGISKEQGQGILQTYTQFEIEQFQKYTNADELETNISKMFNNNTEQRKTVEGLLKEFLPEKDQQFLQTTAPNYTIEMFYKVAKGLVDKYGYKENSAQSNNPAKVRMSDADKNAEYDRLYNRLLELDNSPNQKVGERDEIVKRMREIFQ